MSVSQKIRIVMLKKNVSLSELAKRLETSPQNLNGKLQRDSFSEKTLQMIASALGCNVEINLVDEETGEKLA